MRIVSGQLRGHQFSAPAGHKTHPMSDKIRGALFNSLGDIKGLTLLDAFAGSGAVAFEAISRGAKECTLIELDKAAHQTIQANIALLGLSNAQATRINIASWSNRNQSRQFDLVICDPPYDQVHLGLIQKLVRHVKTGGVLVLSWPGFLESPLLVGMEQLSNKTYGDAQLVFFRRAS